MQESFGGDAGSSAYDLSAPSIHTSPHSRPQVSLLFIINSLNSDDYTICRHSHFEPLFCHSILAWMSEVEVTMRRGNRLEISLARVEKMLNDNQDTVAALQEAITKVEVMTARNRNTSNSNDNITSNEEEDRAMERRWWRRKEE